MCLKKKIARIPHLRLICSLSRKMDIDTYLVGGFLRDLYLDKGQSFDFDFALKKNILKFSSQFSQSIGAKLIILDEFDRTYRVIVREKGKV